MDSWMFFPQHGVFLILTLLSHIGASLFFAKPRFGKLTTAVIWLIYGVVFLILPQDSQQINFFVSFGLHAVLFFITTTGNRAEKGFLLFSYASMFTCVSTIFIQVDYRLENALAVSLLGLVLMTAAQLVLYLVLLPSFRKVAPYIHRGWGKFYAAILAFFALIIGQTQFPVMMPMNAKECVIFLLTILAFCITYICVFDNMKSMVELSRERQKQIHTELLQAQVDAQAKEAEFLRRNRHDMRHHYQIMLSFARDGELDKLTAYLQQQTESIEATTTGRFCENETINSILKVFYQKAAAQDIAMEIRAAAKPVLSVPNPQLVAVIANVLENALHGALSSGSKEPVIKVAIKHKAGRLVISCDNSCKKTLDFAEMPEYLQGIGIHSILTTAQKYNGTCRFSAADGIFHCVVVMDE